MTGVQTCAHRSEEHTSELQSHDNLVCRLLLEKKRVGAAGVEPGREAGLRLPDEPLRSPDRALRAGTRVGDSLVPGLFFFNSKGDPQTLPPFPTRAPSD